MEINYIGENLFPGQLGHFFVSLSFGAALLCFIAYVFLAQKREELGWRLIGRLSFFVHTAAVLGIIGTMFYLIYNHEFQYYYVWNHSSLDLPVHFMISCFWEGQEGSFLLWTFWHLFIGVILIFNAGKWEAPVMATVALAQVALSSMLLGLEFTSDFRIGSNPFNLLRNVFPDEQVFSLANYVPLISDGNGLNPLLQNYWMVIHPPVLFIGFATMIVPFAYAIGGLWFREYKSWIAPALPWALFAVISLGAGILMGGAWAYETLNFGGYWAWDPVENASLVPWILMIAAVHTMIIFKKSGTAVVTTFILVIFSFLTVLYATFLTRSGILGDTSVHSFTDLGLSGQLLVFILLFLFLAFGFFFKRYNELPVTEKEEKLYSREFWMFIGALVLSLSAFQVIFTTSIPVMNHIPGLDLAPPVDPISHYNKFQLPFAIIIGFLTGFGQFLKFKNTSITKFYNKLYLSLLIALLISAALILITDIRNWAYILMLYACVYAVVGNFFILIPMLLKGKKLVSGASVSHIGFGLLLLGALVSSAKQEVVSINKSNVSFGDMFDEDARRENIALFKHQPVRMQDYVVTYRGDSISEPNRFYKVEYRRFEPGTDRLVERFMLYPSAQINPTMGLIASPDTRHYITRDIYTHVTSVPDPEDDSRQPEYETADTVRIQLGDTISADRFTIIVRGMEEVSEPEELGLPGQVDMAYRLRMDVYAANHDWKYELKPAMVFSGNELFRLEDEIPELPLRSQIINIMPEIDRLDISIETGKPMPDYIIMKAIKFPFINLLWLGMVVLVIGFTIAIVHRVKEYNRSKRLGRD